MSKRILSLVLALVMVLGTFGTVFAAETENAKVAKLVELGLVTGDEGGLRLADPIRRSEVAAMVVRAAGLEAIAKASTTFASPFKDMNAAHWANGYVNVAAGRGYVNGYPDGSFVPENNITYAEVAAMLVRVLGGLTEAEAKAAKWPTTYLAKALELGILKDVEITNFEEVAQREFVFEMVFNTITAKGSNLVVANTIEGIVVENYRTESLNQDEVVVHVMKDQVQRTDGSKYYEEGDEYKLVLTEELKAKGLDVETLLGKVVTVSYDKAGKVVGVEVNNDYEYLQGALTEADTKEIKLAGKYYTIGKDEARTAFDERLYQVYLNNEDVSYREFLDEVNADFAKATVRNGKVLFLETFAFEDIAPVAKDIDSKDRVTFFDDADGGDLDTLVVDEDAFVITFEENTVKLGNYEDIKANDVIHWYEDAKGNLTVFVRPEEDNKVEGEYKDASAAKAKDAADIRILVDKTEYPADIKTENRNPVYSRYASEMEYLTLTEDYDIELEDFEKKEVVVLLDMFGKVQLIGSETVDGRFYAVITDTYNYDFRLLRGDGSNDWYDTDKATKFEGVLGNTREQKLADFNEGDLVLVTADEDYLISKLENVTGDSEDVTKFNKDVITVDGETYYVGKNAQIFYAQEGKAPAAYANFAAFNKVFDVTKAMSGYVITERVDNVADVIVITAAEKDVATAEYDEITAKVKRVRFTGTRYYLELTTAAGETTTHEVVAKTAYANEDYSDALEAVKDKPAQIVAGDIITVEVTKDDAAKVVSYTAPLAGKGAFKVVKLEDGLRKNERFITVDEDGTEVTYWTGKDALVFGEVKVGSYLQFAADADKVISIAAVVSAPAAPADPELPEEGLEVLAIDETEKLINIGGTVYNYAFASEVAEITEGDFVTFETQVVNGKLYAFNIKKVAEQ